MIDSYDQFINQYSKDCLTIILSNLHKGVQFQYAYNLFMYNDKHILLYNYSRSYGVKYLIKYYSNISIDGDIWEISFVPYDDRPIAITKIKNKD